MATIKDVAREAGLTVTTVSRVLNNRGYISEDAKKKVNDAMKKLHYKPNEMARSLHRKSSNIIGIIVPHIKHPYFSEMISNIENEARKSGLRILLCNSQASTEKEKEYLDICTGNRVAGIILFSGAVSISEFTSQDIPVIVMEREMESALSSVVCDNHRGGELAAEKLIGDGCKHLLYIGSASENVKMPADQRAIGFKEACASKDITLHEIHSGKKSFENMTYTEMIRKALSLYPDTDGIFASSDVIGAQCIIACAELGIEVPKDIKIVGFDDTMIASLTCPGLTTIHQPIKEMAALAVGMLRDAMDGKIVPKHTVLPVTLIERGTA